MGFCMPWLILFLSSFLRSLARDDLVQPGEITVGFLSGIINFVRYQTVLSGLTYLSRRCDLIIMRVRSVA